MIIEGLATSESELLQNEAHAQAQKWLKSNYKAYNKAGAMFEKVGLPIENKHALKI